MPDMRVIVAAVNGPNVQYESYLDDGRSVGGVISLTIGGIQATQHSAIVDAAKAAQVAAHGVTFDANAKIELWCGRAT